MEISNHIGTLCRQKAVYWGSPVNDGYGHYTFATPVEIKCRWDGKEQIVSKDDEKAVIFRSVIYVLQDVDTEGLLWLGELSDLTIAQKAAPHDITGIMIIKRFEKTPALRSRSYLRKAFLSPYMY